MEQNFLKRVTTTTLLLMLFFHAFGQVQKVIPSHWWLQLSSLNPAASGINYELDAALGSQLGRSDFDFNGSLLYFRVDKHSNMLKSGFGFSYFNSNPEALGNRDSSYLMMQRFVFNYNYQFTFADASVLSAGVMLDITRNSWNIDWFAPSTPNDPAIPPPSGMGNDLNLGFGLQYTRTNFYAGVSLTPTFNLIDQTNLISPEQELVAYAAYSPKVNALLSLDLGVLYRYVDSEFGASSYLMTNARLWVNQLFYGGVGYAFTADFPDQLDVLLGIDINKKWTLHYGYVIYLSSLNLANSNKHVVSLQFYIPQQKP